MDHNHKLLDHKRYRSKPATVHYRSELCFTPGVVSHDVTTVYERKTLEVLSMCWVEIGFAEPFEPDELVVAGLMKCPSYLCCTYCPPKYPHANDKATYDMAVLLSIYEPFLYHNANTCVYTLEGPPCRSPNKHKLQDHDRFLHID